MEILDTLTWASKPAYTRITADADTPDFLELKNAEDHGLIDLVSVPGEYGPKLNVTLTALGRHEFDRLTAVRAAQEAEAARIREEHGDEIDEDEAAKVRAVEEAGVPLAGASS
jgi:hypothetical protein